MEINNPCLYKLSGMGTAIHFRQTRDRLQTDELTHRHPLPVRETRRVSKPLSELLYSLTNPPAHIQALPINWPKNKGPKSISYYCGAQKGPGWAPDPRDPANANFETQKYATAKSLSMEFCENQLTTLMPKAATSGSKDIDWGILLDQNDQTGAARFDSQY